MADAFPDVGHTMLFMFIYGDDWRFVVEGDRAGQKAAKRTRYESAQEGGTGTRASMAPGKRMVTRRTGLFQTDGPTTQGARPRTTGEQGFAGRPRMRDREGFWNGSGAEDRGRPRPTEVQIKQTPLSAQVDQTASPIAVMMRLHERLR